MADESFFVKSLLVPTPAGLERPAYLAHSLPDADELPSRPEPPPAAPPPAADEEEVFVFPATAAQRRFWLLDQLVPGGNPALNVPLAVRLRGRLDLPALERACDALLARHEILRTTFRYDRGQLCQVIAPAATLRVPLVDVQDFPAGERTRVPDHLAAEEGTKPFDLARGPVCRARLVRVGPEDHTLLFTLHHVVCDGWSNGILLRELAALYGAFAQGKPSPLPELPLQFADFAQWQQDHAADGSFDASLAYWRERLGSPLPILDLPADRPRLATRARAAAGGIRWRPIPAGLVASLKTLAVREGVSGYMLHLAAFALLLSRYDANSGEDILVSTPSANRGRAEIEGLVGLFVNPLLLRTDLSGNPTFAALLGRVRATVLGAFEHADAPFDRLIEEFQPRRLQVNFLYQNAFLQPIRLPGLDFLPLDGVSPGALFEWEAGVIEDATGVRLCLGYNADWFDSATADRVLADYQALLESVAAPGGTATTIRALPLLSAGPDGTGATLLAERWRMPTASARWAERFLEPAPAMAGVALLVTDRHGQRAPVGVPGEIYVHADGLSAEGFRTGDLGVRREDGKVEWRGPLDAQTHVNGLRVDARRVETALGAHPHVRAALVRARPGSAGRLTAYFQDDGAPAALVSAEQLRTFLRERLPEEWLPAAFVPVVRFPATPEGWLDDAHLLAPPEDPAPERSANYEAPYLTIHHQLIDLWQEVLGVSHLGIRDDFFALGGNSLLAMRMLVRVEELCGRALLPATLFRQATVEGLADAILHGGGEEPAPELLAIQESGSKTPIFYFHGDLTGGGYYCMKLARQLGPDQPFYALPPLDVSERPELPSIEAMAAEHLRAIRAVRPHGPYVLGGFCLGGLVAHAAARQLEAQGEPVERLLIIDATARNRRLKNLRRLAERLGRWRHWDAARQLYHFCKWHFLLARLRRWRKLGLREQTAIMRRRVGGVFGRLWARVRPAGAVEGPEGRASVQADSAASVADGSWFDARWDVPLVFLWAAGGHEVRPFGGPATLLLSHDLTGGQAEEPVAREWGRHLPRLDTRELAGSHLACITEHVDGLAETIRRTLAAGSSGRVA